MKVKTTFLGLILTFTCTAALADLVYRWVDSDGTVHYSEKPSKTHESTLVEVHTGYSIEQEAAAEDATPETAGASAESQYCQTAKQVYEVLTTTTGNITKKDEYGIERVLSEDEKKAELANAEVAMDRYCTESSDTGTPAP